MDTQTRHPPESDQDLLDTLWEQLWAFAELHYSVAGCGVIILTLRLAVPRMSYAPLARWAVDYPMLLQIQEYRPPTECIVLLRGGGCKIDRRLYRLRRMVRSA
ncbi:MAG TPA: hypothetical protein VFT99_25205 [Roseiflexaceae bacterium]|nr:hypothetical protein [Roseiflexaceae bacterium]